VLAHASCVSSTLLASVKSVNVLNVTDSVCLMIIVIPYMHFSPTVGHHFGGVNSHR